jgi:Lipoprotein confined to pathogenic Mycobacterium
MERLNHPHPTGRRDSRSHRLLRRGAGLAAALTIALTAAGCTTDGPGGITGASPVDLLNELKTRPSYEESATSYITMLDEVRSAVSEFAPNVKWRTAKSVEFDYGPCAPPYTKIRQASSGDFTSGGAEGGIPDAVWPQVKQAVVAIAGRHGFTDVLTLKDKPGDHMLVIHDKWNASLELGSLEGTSLSLYGPCLLRSQPAPTITTP